MRFAFYGRVSTEDQQDPEASRGWQRSRAMALIERHGEIVDEFFDVGQSRSIPWKRRPEANRLLTELKNPERGLGAVVIGEPQRAFYGNQYGLTFPVFTHYGVDLWVPEVGGAVDPDSEAHDLVMSVFGGMSKGERNRIKIRVRSAMAAITATEGRYLGGRPPYGYRLVDAGPHPNPAKAADGRRLKRLEPDPVTAPVVQRIFREYLMGIGIFAIAQRLTADGIPSPSAYDPERNRHRCHAAWSKSAVRAILCNPRYTGYQVWNRQRKQESLIDVEDVALGHHTVLTWNAEDKWIFSERPAHEALISREIFEQIQSRRRSRGPHSDGRVRRRQKHDYALRSLVFCQTCGRRMQGQWADGRAHYRCRFPSEYAIANKIDHPPNVYVREDRIIEPLDEWLADAFEPRRLKRLLTEVADVRPDEDPAVEAVRRAIVECDRKLAQHRAVLEAGGDPKLVAGWSREIQKQRAQAEERLAELSGTRAPAQPLTTEEIGEIIDRFGGLRGTLRLADPAQKNDLYREFGVTCTYDYTKKTVLVETRPAPSIGVMEVSEGGLEPPCP